MQVLAICDREEFLCEKAGPSQQTVLHTVEGILILCTVDILRRWTTFSCHFVQGVRRSSLLKWPGTHLADVVNRLSGIDVEVDAYSRVLLLVVVLQPLGVLCFASKETYVLTDILSLEHEDACLNAKRRIHVYRTRTSRGELTPLRVVTKTARPYPPTSISQPISALYMLVSVVQASELQQSDMFRGAISFPGSSVE